MAKRDPSKPLGYYCDATRHKPECPKVGCGGCAPPCSARAGQWTDHVGRGPCSRHGGNTRNHKRAAQQAEAREACSLFDLSLVPHRDPADILYDEQRRAQAAMAWFEGEIALAMEAEDDELRDSRWQGWQTERAIARGVANEIQRLGLDRRRVEADEATARVWAAVLARQAILLGFDPDSPEARAASRQALELEAGDGRAAA